jgi:hypothetical protein
MASVTAAEVKYGVPLKTSVGDLFLTATQIEFPAVNTSPATGGVELNLAKLGLTVQAIAGVHAAAAAQGSGPEAGEVASTTAPPAAVWTSGYAVTSLQAAKGEAITSVVPVTVTIKEGKVFLRFLAVSELKKDLLEIATAETANGVIALTSLTVFALGK